MKHVVWYTHWLLYMYVYVLLIDGESMRCACLLYPVFVCSSVVGSRLMNHPYSSMKYEYINQQSMMSNEQRTSYLHLHLESNPGFCSSLKILDFDVSSTNALSTGLYIEQILSMVTYSRSGYDAWDWRRGKTSNGWRQHAVVFRPQASSEFFSAASMPGAVQ